MCRWMTQGWRIYSFMTSTDIVASPKRKLWLCTPTFQMLFAEWIGRSAHFDAVPLLLEAGQQCMTAVQERHRQCVRPLEEPILPGACESNLRVLDRLQLVGGVPPVPEAQDAVMELEMPRVNAARLHVEDRPKPNLLQEEEVDPHLPLRNAREGQTQMIILWPASQVMVIGIGDAGRAERRLAPARLNLPIFHSTDANADVTYEIWRFDVQGWLDQYDEMSMRPHIFGSLQGYPGKWARSLPGGMNISLKDLLRCMDRTFGNMRDYNSMI